MRKTIIKRKVQTQTGDSFDFSLTKRYRKTPTKNIGKTTEKTAGMISPIPAKSFASGDKIRMISAIAR